MKETDFIFIGYGLDLQIVRSFSSMTFPHSEMDLRRHISNENSLSLHISVKPSSLDIFFFGMNTCIFCYHNLCPFDYSCLPW